MAKVSIGLGSTGRVAYLYSYPNGPAADDVEPMSLEATVEYWFRKTLARDGLAGATATARVEGGDVVLDLEGSAAQQGDLRQYADRLPKFLANGWAALTQVIPGLKAEGVWDAWPSLGNPLYRPWRFFMPHGLPMIHQRALQFFHYPPIRLLEGADADYLSDPVPDRVEKLLMANGVKSKADAQLFECVMDATPIAAEDDQGSKPAADRSRNQRLYDYHPKNFPDGLIPIRRFADYQRAQVQLLLNTSKLNDKFTVPIAVYGGHPKERFNELYGTTLKVNTVATVKDIIAGKTTPVIGANHPYKFYIGVQGGGDRIGSGQPVDDPKVLADSATVMQDDLIVAGWLARMADDPSQDPQKVLDTVTKHWKAAEQIRAKTILFEQQASLLYTDKVTMAFTFRVQSEATALAAAKKRADRLKEEADAAAAVVGNGVAPGLKAASPAPKSAPKTQPKPASKAKKT